MKKEKIEASAVVILFVLLFAAIAHNFLSQNLWDYDFWWHISTGRYIVETGSLPEADPFSYASSMKENENFFPEWENLVLKQYWLGQIIFYLVYQNTGAAGMIVLRTAMLLLALLIVLWQLRRWDVSFYITYIYIFLAYLVLLLSTGERPVLFTILFTPLVFVILEDFKDREGKLLFLLPPLMLFWANVHGGFIIGNIMIMVYMVTEGLKMLLKKTEYSRRRTMFFYSAIILALAASYINPLGWDAFIMAFSPKYAQLQVGIQEYQSPFYNYFNKYQKINIGVVTLAFLFPLLLLVRNKKMDLTHIVLLAGFFSMAAKASRFTAFYSLIAAMVMGRETNIFLQNLFKKRIPGEKHKKMIHVFNAVAFLSITVYFIAFTNIKGFEFDVAWRTTVPVGAVDFIEDNKLAGNIYNSPGYGGYITWRLYPWKKTFIDTRWINKTITSEWKWMATAENSIYRQSLPEGTIPLWRRLLDHYKINIVLLDNFDSFGNTPELLLTLADDREWVPVYTDLISVIFIRNVPEYKDIIKKFEQPKENIYNIIIYKSSRIIRNNRSPIYLVTLGRTFYKMGRLEDALTAYRYALERLPRNLMLKEKVKELDSELKQKNRDERN